MSQHHPYLVLVNALVAAPFVLAFFVWYFRPWIRVRSRGTQTDSDMCTDDAEDTDSAESSEPESNEDCSVERVTAAAVWKKPEPVGKPRSSTPAPEVPDSPDHVATTFDVAPRPSEVMMVVATPVAPAATPATPPATWIDGM